MEDSLPPSQPPPLPSPSLLPGGGHEQMRAPAGRSGDGVGGGTRPLLRLKRKLSDKYSGQTLYYWKHLPVLLCEVNDECKNLNVLELIIYYCKLSQYFLCEGNDQRKKL